MHVYYKFGLFVIFILSVSTCYTRAAPAANQSSSYDDYPDDYDEDYYSETNADHSPASTNEAQSSTPAYKQKAATDGSTTEEPAVYSGFDLPKRSNHVLEPTCPQNCRCMEDYKYIQCSNSRLTHVPLDLPSTALIIDLSRNGIQELSPSAFANCSKVREINLSSNELQEINRAAFKGLHRLQRLQLSNNILTQVDPNTFEGADDLTSLDLSNNSIELPAEGSFLNQPSLRELSCRNCTWTTLYDETFANLSSLTTLKLDLNDFNKKINTKAFTPLRNLIKLKLPELDETSIQELCDLLKSIDNISFKHFDVSCYELVLGTSFNESVKLAKEAEAEQPAATDDSEAAQKQPISEVAAPRANLTSAQTPTKMATNSSFSEDGHTNGTIYKAGLGVPVEGDEEEKAYQVPVSQELINIMLISIMVVACIGLVIGILCRKDVGGIKTKCCRTPKPDPKDQVHPTEEIPLNKMA